MSEHPATRCTICALQLYCEAKAQFGGGPSCQVQVPNLHCVHVPRSAWLNAYEARRRVVSEHKKCIGPSRATYCLHGQHTRM